MNIHFFQPFGSILRRKNLSSSLTQVASIKYFPAPKTYDDVEFPERTRLRNIERVPPTPPNIKQPKMQKNLKFMRGREEIHNKLLHKQYGIIALTGGRLKFGHFDMIRLACARKLDKKRMFALWRIDFPWQPLTKKGIGHKMGGGKGGITDYVTPIKAERVILEVGGKCDFEEVKPHLDMIVGRLPFKAMSVSQKMLEERELNDLLVEQNNTNPWTMEYIMKNKMGSSREWMRRIDYFYFGKYI